METASLAYIQNTLVFALPYRLLQMTSTEDQISQLQDYRLSELVSDVRIWETETGLQMGIRTPELHQITIRETDVLQSGIVAWHPFFARPRVALLGSAIRRSDGDLIFPLSLDRGPDGRVFVLDAGNSRIQSFDENGKYITQWGNLGAGETEFDFGSGLETADFAGSIVVDHEGFIYVADVGNKRIQKFAP